MGIPDTGTLLVALAALAAAAPIVGVVATGLLAIPGLLASVAVPIGAIALGLDGLKAAASGLTYPFEKLKSAMSIATEAQFTPVFDQLGKILPALEKSLPKVSQGVADLFGGFTSAITSSGGMAQIDSIISNISAALTAAAPGVTLFTNGLLTLANEFAAKLPAISGWFSEMGAQFTSWVDKISADGSLSAAFDGLGATINALVTSLAPLFQQGIDFMGDPEKVNSLTAAIEVLGAVLGGAVTVSGALFEGMTRAADGIKAGWEGVKSLFASVVSAIGQAAASVSGFGSSFLAVVASVVSAGGQVLAEVSSWPGRVAGALAGLAQAGLDAGKNLVQGLINGIGGMISSAVAKAKELASSVANAVTGFLGINSPSKLFTDYGGYTAEGFGKGLVEGFQPVIDQAKALAKKLSDAFDSGLSLSGVDYSNEIEKTLDAIDLEKKSLKVDKNALAADDRTGRKAIQSLMDQLQAQKDILALQEDRISNEAKYGDVAASGEDPFAKAAAGLMSAPVNFAKATGQQFLSDIGIGGNGILSKAITEGIQYIFQIGSVDEALSIKDRTESRQALSVVGRT